MPWNEPGKSSGNDNGKSDDPWGKGRNEPPDLDEVFKNLKNKLGGLGGGKSGRGRSTSDSGSSGSGGFSIFLIVGIVLAAWILFTSPFIVDEAERGVVTRFGEYHRTTTSGLKFKWPTPFESVRKVNVSEVRSIQNRGSMLTSDENVIEVAYSVQYRIDEPYKYLFEVRDPSEVLVLATESAMREVIGANELDYILEEGRGAIGSATRILLQDILNSYATGIQLTNFNLNDVDPPTQVKAAFDDVIKAEKDKERFINEANAYANKVVPEARGQAARVLQEAEAYKASQIAMAEGEASRFNLQLDAYRLAPEVTRQRLYLETLEKVLGSNYKLLLDVSSDGNILYLPVGQGAQQPAALPPLRNAINGTQGINTPSSSSNNNDNTTRSRERGGR